MSKMPKLTHTPHVLVGVTGCIAAYKAAEVVRLLQKEDCKVRVMMSAGGEKFIAPATFSGLTRYPVLDDLFGFPTTEIPHIDSAEWADLQLIVPCTANVVAKIANGLADDALTSTVLAATGPVAIAPAMNVYMWENPATQHNMKALQSRGFTIISPASGRLACGDVGAGKLANVQTIADAALQLLHTSDELNGVKILITAGPTHEAIDPVRYIANASSGKMGYALAQEAERRGAQVTLISGPVSLPAPYGVTVISVTSAQEMYEAAMKEWKDADVALCTAAVADFSPKHPADHKLKKGIDAPDTIELTENKDILASLAATKDDRIVVGFAAETTDLLEHAEEKLNRKHASLIVANDVSRGDSTFGSDTDRVSLIYPSHIEQLDTLPKTEVACHILDAVENLRAQD